MKLSIEKNKSKVGFVKENRPNKFYKSGVD